MIPSRTSGTAGRLRLEINLLNGVTQDHEYYNRLPTGEYRVPLVPKQKSTHLWARALTLGALITITAAAPQIGTPASNLFNRESVNQNNPFERTRITQDHVLAQLVERKKQYSIDDILNLSEQPQQETVEAALETFNAPEYVKQFLRDNVIDALLADKEAGTNYAITSLAIAAHESHYGLSKTMSSNNIMHGILYKPRHEGIARRVTLMSTQRTDNRRSQPGDLVPIDFAAYPTRREAYRDFIRTLHNPVYRGIESTDKPLEQLPYLKPFARDSNYVRRLTVIAQKYTIPFFEHLERHRTNTRTASADD